MKANKTLSNLKKASAALAIIMKLLARFFSQLSSRFVGWLTVSQLPQCALEDLPQEAEEARNRENERLARIQEDNERRNRENERLNREAASRLILERAKTLNQVDAARAA